VNVYQFFREYINFTKAQTEDSKFKDFKDLEEVFEELGSSLIAAMHKNYTKHTYNAYFFRIKN